MGSWAFLLSAYIEFACLKSYFIARMISSASFCMTSTIKVRWWLCMFLIPNFARANVLSVTTLLRFMELVAFALKHKHLLSFEFCSWSSSMRMNGHFETSHPDDVPPVRSVACGWRDLGLHHCTIRLL